MKREISKNFGQVVGFHAVPIIQVLSFESIHLKWECHYCWHHSGEHREKHTKEEHSTEKKKIS